MLPLYRSNTQKLRINCSLLLKERSLPSIQLPPIFHFVYPTYQKKDKLNCLYRLFNTDQNPHSGKFKRKILIAYSDRLKVIMKLSN